MKKSKFNLTHLHSTTLDMGYLVPICLLDCLPNDSFRISLSSFIRAQPMLAPLMHEVNLYTQYWFVPYRLLWDEWEMFITGGNDGMGAPAFPVITAPDGGFQVGSLADYFGFPVNEGGIEVSAMPFRAMVEIWNARYRDEDLQTELPISYDGGNDTLTGTDLLSPSWRKDYFTTARLSTQRGSEISVPVNVSSDVSMVHNVFTGKFSYSGNNPGNFKTKGVSPFNTALVTDPIGDIDVRLFTDTITGWILPIGTRIGEWNAKGISYKHPIVIESYSFNGRTGLDNGALMMALQQQFMRDIEGDLEQLLVPLIPKNTEAVPITKDLPEGIVSPDIATLSGLNKTYTIDVDVGGSTRIGMFKGVQVVVSIKSGSMVFSTRRAESGILTMPDISYSGLLGQWNAYNFDFVVKSPMSGGSLGSVDIRDLRVASALQRYQERSLAFGNRYEEFIQREFGIRPRDARIQRPEYLGGSKSVLQISEVLQTAEGTDTGVGTMRGHGIAGLKQRPIRFTCPEHGVLIGLLSIRPKPVYTQGIDRAWLKRTKLDFFVPELANVGMQEVFQQELFATKDNKNFIFGYSERNAEYRSMRPRVTGEFRTDMLSYWNLARKFEQPPVLNGSFINMANSATTFKRPFAVQNQHAFLAMIRNNIRAWRPIPKRAKNILK